MTTVADLQRGFVSPKLAPAVRVRNRGARKADRWPSSRFTMSNSAVLFVPAARCCARVCPSLRTCLRFRVRRRAPRGLWRQRPSRQQQFRPPPMRGGWSADRRTLLCYVARARRDDRVSETRAVPLQPGRPLGAPPWRFSAGGRASISGIASGSVQRAPRSQVVMPGGRCPGPPESAVTSRSRGTPLPAPPSGSSLEDAPS